MNAGQKKRFAGVDVADANHDRAVHDELLHIDSPAARCSPQIIAVELRLERFGTEIAKQRMLRCILRP
jgi:hypothetical protein